MDTKTIEENLRKLIQKNPSLPYALAKLASANIRYGLYAGAHVAVLTNNRIPTDIDLLVHDDDLPKLRELFPFAKSKDVSNGVFLYIGENDDIEFMGAAHVLKDQHVYPFNLTDEAAGKLSTHVIDGLKVNLVDPVDSILLKSILQRGAEQNKHDIDDIKAVVEAIEIDTTYLRKRLEEADALELASPLFHSLGIQL